jgi:cobalt/nickel transport system ATP-binding protein
VNPVLEFKSVTIRYSGNSRDTVKNISFHIHPDERVALFGLNGSGKTTLLLAAIGLVPFTGSIRVDGIHLEKKSLQKARNRTGFLFNIPEDQILFPRVLDDVAYGLIRRGKPIRVAHKKALSTLAELGVSDTAENSPFQLSHGQRQRIALAGALVTKPSVLLLDEPTSGLDPLGRLSLAKLLRNIPSSILIATHDVQFALQTCNRFLVLYEGDLREFNNCRDAERCLLGKSFIKKPGKTPH